MNEHCGLCGSRIEAETGLCVGCHRGIRFVLIPAVGAPLPLCTGKVLTFGRDPGCSVPINDPTVSRLHAELRWRNGLPELRDASRHGTLVNGQPIDLRALQSRDLVRIGGFQFTLLDRQRAQFLPQGQATEAEDFAVLQGRVTPGSLCEVVQSLALGRKTGKLHVSSEAGEKSWLTLRDGAPIAARHESETQGIEAALCVLATSTGRFVFCEGEPGDPLEFRTSLMSLLLEASRRQDEGEATSLRDAAAVLQAC